MSTSLTRQIFLLVAYKRTGKDTFYRDCISSVKKHSWLIFVPPEKLSRKITLPNLNVSRFAFADLLKDEVAAKYDVPRNISDEEKDLAQWSDPRVKSDKPVSARDIYKYWGLVRRQEDVNYWCKQLFLGNSDVVVTDCRFFNEVEYTMIHSQGGVVTIRLSRKDVEVPPLDDVTEHELDSILTDYLLIPADNWEQEWIEAKQRFPQYARYIPQGVFC